MPTKSSPTTATGWVSFIGTGPGDPDLITVRAVELIRAADVVITESAQQVDLVAQLTAGATPEVIESDFGGAADLAQAAKAKHVLAAAKAGRRVARLVSGDAALWSSASDEATLVAKAGIGFEIVPGVSPAAAVPTYAGMPLGAVDAVGVIRCAGTRDWVNRFDWAAHLATPTLVILGAAECLSAVVESLLAAGKPGRTPVAVTSGGTTTEQATVSATLDSIVMETRAARLDDAVLVVGDVVAARDSLSWFESKPLFGWRVLVPRTKEQAGGPSRAWSAARLPTRCPRSRSSHPATRCRWTKRCADWLRAAMNGSPSPRSTPSRRCGRSSRTTASTLVPSPD